MHLTTINYVNISSQLLYSSLFMAGHLTGQNIYWLPCKRGLFANPATTSSAKPIGLGAHIHSAAAETRTASALQKSRLCSPKTVGSN